MAEPNDAQETVREELEELTDDERAAYAQARNAVQVVLDALPDWIRWLVVADVVYGNSPAGEAIEEGRA